VGTLDGLGPTGIAASSSLITPARPAYTELLTNGLHQPWRTVGVCLVYPANIRGASTRGGRRGPVRYLARAVEKLARFGYDQVNLTSDVRRIGVRPAGFGAFLMA